MRNSNIGQLDNHNGSVISKSNTQGEHAIYMVAKEPAERSLISILITRAFAPGVTNTRPDQP